MNHRQQLQVAFEVASHMEKQGSRDIARRLLNSRLGALPWVRRNALSLSNAGPIMRGEGPVTDAAAALRRVLPDSAERSDLMERSLSYDIWRNFKKRRPPVIDQIRDMQAAGTADEFLTNKVLDGASAAGRGAKALYNEAVSTPAGAALALSPIGPQHLLPLLGVPPVPIPGDNVMTAFALSKFLKTTAGKKVVEKAAPHAKTLFDNVGAPAARGITPALRTPVKDLLRTPVKDLFRLNKNAPSAAAGELLELAS